MAERQKSKETEEKIAALSQYTRLLREIREDRARLAQLDARGKRQATAPAGLPDLHGCSPAELAVYRDRIAQNVERCVSLACGLQQYITAIGDSDIRRMFIWRYIYGYSWQKVACAMGGGDESAYRKRHNRYLERQAAGPIPPLSPAVPLHDTDVALRRAALETGQ